MKVLREEKRDVEEANSLRIENVLEIRVAIYVVAIVYVLKFVCKRAPPLKALAHKFQLYALA